MISAINSKTHFTGTTIIKGEGSSILTREIHAAADNSRPGYINTRLDGFTVVAVADVFEKEEADFLKGLRGKRLKYANFSQSLDYNSIADIKLLIKNLVKSGLL